MAKIVTYDTLSLQGANVWIDLAAQEVRLEARFSLSSGSEDAPVIDRAQEVHDLLTQAERDAILDIATRLKQALEAQELV